MIYKPSGKALEYSDLACNIYTGCTHGCKYCYAPVTLHMDLDKFNSASLRLGSVDRILTQLRKDITWMYSWKMEGTPVLFCFSCDPYQPELDKQYHTMRHIINLFIQKKIPMNILTKSDRVRNDFDIFTDLPPQSSIGSTLTFSDDEMSMEWEPKASLPQHRTNMLYTAHTLGIKTWASLEPIIDPAQTLDLINQTHSFVDHYKVGRWNYDQRANGMDWSDIRYRIENRLIELGKSYYIKKDLNLPLSDRSRNL